MKKKIFLMIAIISMLACLFAFSVSAEVTTYDDAPVRTNYQALAEDVVVFDDGFSCPTSYVFKDQKEVYNGGHKNPTLDDCFDFSYINSKTGKTYAFSNIVELDVPQGITYVGTYAAMGLNNLKRVTFPDSVTSFGQCVFQQATGLEECVFEHTENSNLTTFPNYFFYGTPLKAFSMPDCITKVDGQAHFSNCANLTALHISKNLTAWNSGSQGNASFFNCKNMYFVEEAFTYDAIPQKPSIYHFPANLATITGETFKTCTSLNDYLVFGTSLVDIDNTGTIPWAFNGCGNTSTVVFLGDMQGLAIGNGSNADYWNVKNIVFAHPNDKSANDIGLIGKSSSKLVFCNADGNTTHFVEKTVVEPAKCETNAGEYTYCFCGYAIDKKEIEGTALDHDNDYLNGKATLISVSYDDLSKDGKKTVKCGLCGKDSELTASKVIDYKGYSKNDKGAMCMGYNIDQAALKDYESKNGALTYGFVASANNNAPLEANGDKKDNVVKADLTGSVYNAVDFILTADDWTAESVANAEISINLYVIVNNAVKYITVNGYSDATEATKYSDIP